MYRWVCSFDRVRSVSVPKMVSRYLRISLCGNGNLVRRSNNEVPSRHDKDTTFRSFVRDHFFSRNGPQQPGELESWSENGWKRLRLWCWGLDFRNRQERQERALHVIFSFVYRGTSTCPFIFYYNWILHVFRVDQNIVSIIWCQNSTIWLKMLGF